MDKLDPNGKEKNISIPFWDCRLEQQVGCFECHQGLLLFLFFEQDDVLLLLF